MPSNFSEVQVTGVGSSDWVLVNSYKGPKSIFVNLDGTATWSVEHTPNHAAGTPWIYPHETLVSQTAAQGDGNYRFPVDAIRVTVSVGTGTVSMIVIEEK